ncbi:MAG TPA: hypothetical protein VH165_21250 [Kofleriaceae bacterium]|jgi:hypothetical protein|nr:hypothetical protein [Kofleriaceae bacterium]
MRWIALGACLAACGGPCLYARPDGEPIGYIVDNQPVELDDGAAAGWWTLTAETPWGPLAFAARGPARTELVACAPAGAVPPVAAAPSAP